MSLAVESIVLLSVAGVISPLLLGAIYPNRRQHIGRNMGNIGSGKCLTFL